MAALYSLILDPTTSDEHNHNPGVTKEQYPTDSQYSSQQPEQPQQQEPNTTQPGRKLYRLMRHLGIDIDADMESGNIMKQQ
jgi:hypothetical protein